MSRNYDVSTGEIKASLEGYKKEKKKSGYKKDDKKVDIIIKSLEFLNDNLEVTYDRNNVSGLKLNIFLRNASSYLKKYPELLSQSAILSTVIFNALIIVALIPLALKGVSYRPAGAASLLKRNILIYGVGGLIAPFMGIKLIDMVINAWRLV